MGEPRSIWKSARDDPRSSQADCSYLLTSIIRFSREGGIVSGAELGLTPSFAIHLSHRHSPCYYNNVCDNQDHGSSTNERLAVELLER